MPTSDGLGSVTKVVFYGSCSKGINYHTALGACVARQLSRAVYALCLRHALMPTVSAMTIAMSRAPPTTAAAMMSSFVGRAVVVAGVGDGDGEAPTTRGAACDDDTVTEVGTMEMPVGLWAMKGGGGKQGSGE